MWDLRRTPRERCCRCGEVEFGESGAGPAERREEAVELRLRERMARGMWVWKKLFLPLSMELAGEVFEGWAEAATSVCSLKRLRVTLEEEADMGGVEEAEEGGSSICERFRRRMAIVCVWSVDALYG